MGTLLVVDTITAVPGEAVALSPDRRVAVSPRARKLAAEKGIDLATAGITPTGGEGVRIAERDVLAYLASAPKATPVAQRLAAETGVDLRSVTGTGPGGRITKEDVEQAVRPVVAAASVVAPAAPVLLSTPAPLPAVEVTERIPLKGVRAIIADRMGTSVHTTARVTLMMEIDATEFMAIRERLKAKVAEEWGFAPGHERPAGEDRGEGAAQIPVHECPPGARRHRAAGPRQHGHGGGHRARTARPGDPRR